MSHPDTAVVTGAFSYTGKYIARRLLGAGVRVRTLTGHPDREDPFGGAVEVAPLDFADGAGLRRAMDGAGVLYNTYWVRFARGETTFERAVANSRTLFEAARDAGVSRIVHVSITNADSGSRLPYFSGKGRVEEALKALGMPLCHRQADAGLRRRGRAVEQHGVGHPALPVLSHRRQRRIPRPTDLRRRSCRTSGGRRFRDRTTRSPMRSGPRP